ncbi:MAG: sigma-54-dependent Fis family transcriptional regulator [Alphaproteobacteria bacterium]|nr:sigma-54-dependent Fis family transcriptional regulator [Alphaproteobacteria bacterium]
MRLLIVGHLEGYITEAGRIAVSKGAKVAHIDDVDPALNALRNGQGADLVMCDIKLELARFIENLKAERINVPVVACGIGTDANAAVRAIRAGAKEYVPLPPDADLIAAVLEAVTEESNTVIGRDPAMRAVLEMAERIAPSEASVLITGESGTGKEVVARYIHRKSKRAAQNFVSVNCAAIPENLLESELFGHEKGAFTGAIARRVGKFEEAHGGTLLLDEISEMDLRLQAKLLRAIQEREIDRVGGTQPVKVDIRLLATSNRDLEAEVKAKRFREDLYFRLNVVNLVLPSLRERPADIVPLAAHFAEKYAMANGLAPKTLSPETVAALAAHHWRGNVREMENTMHRAVLLARGNVITLDAVMLSGQSFAPDGVVSSTAAAAAGGKTVPMVGRTVADVERDLIIDTLQHTLGNRTHAANILGISIRTLRNKLKQYSEEGVPVPAAAAGEAEQAAS